MAAFMRGFDAQVYAAFRIVTGILFFLHGSSKLFSFPTPAPEAPAFILYGAGGIELVAGALIALGLFTRWSAFIASGQMAAAYWMAHGMNGLFPIANGGELAVLYCFAFLFISSRGAGIWSVEGLQSGAAEPAAN